MTERVPPLFRRVLNIEITDQLAADPEAAAAIKTLMSRHAALAAQDEPQDAAEEHELAAVEAQDAHEQAQIAAAVEHVRAAVKTAPLPEDTGLAAQIEREHAAAETVRAAVQRAPSRDAITDLARAVVEALGDAAEQRDAELADSERERAEQTIAEEAERASAATERFRRDAERKAGRL